MQTPDSIPSDPTTSARRRSVITARRAAMQSDNAPRDMVSRVPAGFDRGLRVSERLTSEYRKQYREGSMDIGPSDVIKTLVDADVRRWVLMGLHGYVGYLPETRATQDVDVLVDHSDRETVVEAISKRWPELLIREAEVVVRFLDPKELDASDRPIAVIDVMLPWSNLHAEILQSQVLVEGDTGRRLPTVEAAIVAKYAAMVSPHRMYDKKQQDSVDFRRITNANTELFNIDEISRLAELVWEGATADILELIDASKHERSFEL